MEWSGLYHHSSCESFKFRCSSPPLPENTALSCELGEFAPITPLSHSLLSSSLLMISACFTVVPTPDLCSLWKCEFKVSWIWVFSCQGSLCIVSCLLSCFKEEQIGAGRWIGRRIVFSRFSGTGFLVSFHAWRFFRAHLVLIVVFFGTKPFESSCRSSSTNSKCLVVLGSHLDSSLPQPSLQSEPSPKHAGFLPRERLLQPYCSGCWLQHIGCCCLSVGVHAHTPHSQDIE